MNKLIINLPANANRVISIILLITESLKFLAGKLPKYQGIISKI